MARLLVLVIVVAGVLYLGATQLSRSTTSTGQGKNIIEQPDRARQEVNQSLNKAEKAREDAAKSSQ